MSTVSTPDLVPLLRRLDRLERQNRWLKGLGVALLCLVSIGGLMGARQAETKKIMTAEKFVLQDGNGKPRIMLATDKDQDGIIFYDNNGRMICTLVVKSEGVALRFLQGEGRFTSGISCERGGVGLVGINDSGRRQTEVNAIIVPSQVLLNPPPFNVSPTAAPAK